MVDPYESIGSAYGGRATSDGVSGIAVLAAGIDGGANGTLGSLVLNASV